MKTKIKIHFLVAVILVTTIFKTWAQDGGYLPDLPGFPSGTYAQVAAVGVKIHGYLSATEMHPETGDRKRFIRMTYYGPTDTYARMGICSLYTDPATVARYANPSKEDGRDVLVERRSIKYYRRDGSGGGYSLWYYKAGAVDKLFEYEFKSEDIGMPSPGAVGRPFENLSATDSLEIKFVPKATIFTLKNEESRRPDDVMGAMLLRLEGAAGAASEEVQGIIELGSMVFDPMKAAGLAQNMGQAIVHWDQTMAAIQRQVDDTANTYWESRVGLINPEDAYRKEGAFLYHLASNVTGGWAVKGAGKAKLAGKVDDVAGLAAKKISTGRTVPNSLKEKLAMEQVMANPMGITPPRMPPMSDTKNNLLAADGWVKRAQIVNDVEIHYVENISTKQMVDFKFVKP
ncbi:MAG: hypothetical protein NT050_11800 [Verrucomicrobia bacterium]|nr:hypothetical protein [Verrucomicrobiota bacterium]